MNGIVCHKFLLLIGGQGQTRWRDFFAGSFFGRAGEIEFEQEGEWGIFQRRT